MTVTIQLLTDCEPFSDLMPPARQALSEAARSVEFKPGERLVPMGQQPERLLVIQDGLAKLVGISSDGHERILYLHRSGDLIGASVLLDNFQQDFEVAAMSPVKALSISRRDLMRVCRTHPAIILTLAREVSRMLSEMTDRVLQATSAEVPIRLSKLLLDFAAPAADLAPLSYPLTHELMAQIVGASRPHTSTVLRDLENAGAVRRQSRRGLLVRASRLREIVEDGELFPEPRGGATAGMPIAWT